MKRLYETLGPTDPQREVFHFLTGDPHNATVERANLATHPMLATTTRIHGVWCPVYANPTGLNWNKVQEIAVQHDIFTGMCRLIQTADLSVDLQAQPELLMKLMEICYRKLADSRPLYAFAEEFMLREEAYTRQILRSQAQIECAKNAGVPVMSGGG